MTFAELAQNPTVVTLWDGYLQRHPQAGEPGATPPALWVVRTRHVTD